MSLTDRTPGAASAPAGPPAGGRHTGPDRGGRDPRGHRRDLPVRVTGYDGSAVGPADAGITLSIRTERGLSYLLTAPGDLGMARAYVSGDLGLEGVHPGDPYEALRVLKDELRLRLPPVADALALVRGWAGSGCDRRRPRRRRPQPALAAGDDRAASLAGPGQPARSRTTTTCPTPSTRRCSARP